MSTSTRGPETSSANRTGRVVAELGRPETAAETAARKAESSRLHRSRQTINNLVYSLLATLALVLVIILVVPRNNSTTPAHVDYRSAAAQGAGAEADPLLAPELPKGWWANAAQLNTAASGGVDGWHIGFVTPTSSYVGLDQGFHANDAWTTNMLDNITATGTTTIAGVKWVVYDNRDGQYSGQAAANTTPPAYALVAQQGASTVVLQGSASLSDFRTVASALAPSLLSDSASSLTAAPPTSTATSTGEATGVS